MHLDFIFLERGMIMKYLKKALQAIKTYRIFICLGVILFGVIVMLVPIINSIHTSRRDFTSILTFFNLGVLFFHLLPGIIYFFVTMKTKNVEYIIIPPVFLMVAEFYFFHNYSTWIASDANAGIALIFIPFYLMLILGFSYGIAFVILKIKRNIMQK